MKQIVIAICWLWPVALFAQQRLNRPFVQFENWQSVLLEAKKQKKNIFVDAYTTWCGPCRQMDKEVYRDKRVVAYLDSNFISIKVQIDRNDKDPVEVKTWYGDARMLSEKYNITSFPSLIFVDQDGRLVDIRRGFHSVPEFIAILNTANDPQKAYYKQISDFEAGKIPLKDLLKLAIKANEYKEDSLALEIARKYKLEYLDKQKLEYVINPELLFFLGNFGRLISLKDRIVQYSYSHPPRFDSLIQRGGAAESVTDFYINRDLVQPRLDNYSRKHLSNYPRWKEIENAIAKRYDRRTARRVIVNQQIRFYQEKSDWENVAKYEIERIDLNGLDTVGMGKVTINNMVFNVIFQHVDIPFYLNKAIGYMEILLESDPNIHEWIDTYANLLYKAGRKEEALRHEERALVIARQRNSISNFREYSQNLDKMKANLPTWAINHP